MITANRAHPASTLIDRFRPLQEAFATPARVSLRAGSKLLTEIALSVLAPGRSRGEIDNSPCYPAFTGVGELSPAAGAGREPVQRGSGRSPSSTTGACDPMMRRG